MSEQGGNLFTQENIQEIVDVLKVDLGDDDGNVFQAKVAAMQRFLRYGMSKFSKEKLYQHLCIVARRVTVQERMTSWNTQNNTVIKSIGHLRAVIRDMHGKDKYNGLLECERQAIRYFLHFLVDVDHIKCLKGSFDKEVHTVLYYDYFDPSDWSPSQKKSAGTKGGKPEDKDSGNYSMSELDEKHEQVTSLKPPNGGNSPRGSVSPRGDNSPRGKYDDSFTQVGFSFSKHLDGSEKEKLRVTVNELEEVSERWDRLLMEDDQDLEDYDPESYYEVMECEEHTKFEAVFRLLSDIFAKCYKVIELSKQWWNLAHKIYKKLPLRRPVSRGWPRCRERSHRSGDNEEENPETTQQEPEVDESAETSPSGAVEVEDEDFGHLIHVPEPQKQQKQDRVTNIKARLFDLSYAIHELDQDLADHKVDLRKLDSRERRFQMLEILFGKVDANLEEIQEKCRKLRAQRKVTAQKYSYTFRGTEKYFDYREKLRRLDKKLMKYDNEIQLLVYKQNVVSQDYMLEMEIRPNFIRSYEDLRTQITDKEHLLQQRQGEKKDLEEELELLEPDGLAGRSRKSENGSSSGHSVLTDLKGEITDDIPTSHEKDYNEVFNGLGKRYELVSSAPPVKTQLRNMKKKEEVTPPVKKPAPPSSETLLKTVTTIDGSNLIGHEKPKFQSPRPPQGLKKRARKPFPGKRGVKQPV
ncbi:uncharacterized protein LOC124140419 isoform X1 [Haliotis rufescens]|uniref:uncharacterized protein LOC124140419 isoform X1 n=2 Tax=Haliotis rufescens TaxID=6454 RepID=UPI00201ED408|nr:uncharacterized protein LOC124140419 isoform X1 [Haliotis rufescens]